MTLTDQENNNQEVYTSDINNTVKKNMPEKLKMPVTNPTAVGETLKEVVATAIEQGRATFGPYQAGQFLEQCPEEVMLCLLPESDDSDVTLHIHFTLIEAFCWENRIPLIKVDKAENLKKMICNSDCENNNIEEHRVLSHQDFNCIIIEFPAEECSEADEDILEYYKLTADVTPQPIIQLPV